MLCVWLTSTYPVALKPNLPFFRRLSVALGNDGLRRAVPRCENTVYTGER